SDRIYLLQANPGKIAKTVIVPESICSLSQLEARHHYDLPALFQDRWKELERLG
ncbi:spermidine/putrescine ABC transporter ATP-binding protein, partial [Bacillus thuringiensis]|nr:spermidine/putrescine ABC transporter ATP-binding protein [Bacillus thuringiensis]